MRTTQALTVLQSSLCVLVARSLRLEQRAHSSHLAVVLQTLQDQRLVLSTKLDLLRDVGLRAVQRQRDGRERT